jgi:hypothetical protein
MVTIADGLPGWAEFSLPAMLLGQVTAMKPAASEAAPRHFQPS